MATKNNGRKPSAQRDRFGIYDTPEERKATDAVLADLVGIAEIADRLSVPRTTVEKWRQRAKQYAGTEWAFPEPRTTIATRGVWLFTTDILPWLEATGREWYAEGDTSKNAVWIGE